MKRVLVLALAAALLASGCAAKKKDAPGVPLAAPAEGDALDPARVSAYAIYPANTMYIYDGDAATLSNWHVYHDYDGGGRAQKRFLLGGATTLEVLDYSGGELRQVYGMAVLDSEGRVTHADLRGLTPNADVVLLKEPIVVGAKWTQSETAGDGAQSEITAVDKPVTVPYGNFNAVEVTTVHAAGQYEQRDYYAPGVGLIKVVTVIDGQESVSALAEIQTGQKVTEPAALFYPEGGQIGYETLDLPFETNVPPIQTLLGAALPVLSEKFGTDFSNVTLRATEVDPAARTATVDFSASLIARMNQTPDADTERLILQCAVNTLAYLLNVDDLRVTVDGGAYASDKVRLAIDDYIAVNFAQQAQEP